MLQENSNQVSQSLIDSVRNISVKIDSLHSSIEQINKTQTEVVGWGDFQDLILVFLLALLVVGTIAFIRHRNSKESEGDYFVNTLPNYFAYILIEHKWAHVLFLCLTTVLAGSSLFIYKIYGDKSVGQISNIYIVLFTTWGILITFISAYYASKAENTAKNAYREARSTNRSLAHFADSLSHFIEKVKLKVDDAIKEETQDDTNNIKIKFLSIIPSFGRVGLEDYYREMRKHDNDYEEFHRFLFNRLQNDDIKSLELITHTGQDCKKWLEDIFEVNSKGKNDSWNILNNYFPDFINQENVDQKQENQHYKKEAKKNYEEQKEYLEKLYLNFGPKKFKCAYWNGKEILDNSDETSENPRIPFQFLILETSQKKSVFFLFSGSFYYSHLLKSLKEEIDMEKLVNLTKGYYVDYNKSRVNEDEKSLTKLFHDLFEHLFESFEEEQLPFNKIEEHIGNKYPPFEEIENE